MALKPGWTYLRFLGELAYSSFYLLGCRPPWTTLLGFQKSKELATEQYKIKSYIFFYCYRCIHVRLFILQININQWITYNNLVVHVCVYFHIPSCTHLNPFSASKTDLMKKFLCFMNSSLFFIFLFLSILAICWLSIFSNLGFLSVSVWPTTHCVEWVR